MPVVLLSAGSRLLSIDLESDARLIPRSSIELPAAVQYAWPHAREPIVYVATSNGGPGSADRRGDRHHITALRVDPRTRRLSLHAPPQPLGARPIHLTTDGESEHAVVTYNMPPGVTVHRVERGGGLGGLVRQPLSLDFGIYPHQARVGPSNRFAVVVARGNSATP